MEQDTRALIEAAEEAMEHHFDRLDAEMTEPLEALRKALAGMKP